MELKKLLTKVEKVLPQMSLEELITLAAQWQVLVAYSNRLETENNVFMEILKEIMLLSPTLTKHKFADVLDSTIRFGPPASNAPVNAPIQGLPPVHNEVLEIEQKIKELLSQFRPKE